MDLPVDQANSGAKYEFWHVLCHGESQVFKIHFSKLDLLVLVILLVLDLF